MIQNTPPMPTQGQTPPQLSIDNWVIFILFIAVVYGYWYLKKIEKERDGNY